MKKFSGLQKSLLFFVVFLITLSGCSKKTMFVLLPDPDGKVGHLTVSNEGGRVDITQPSEATVVSGKGSRPTPPEVVTQEEIDSYFSEVLTVLPEPPIHFILYFKTESTKLTPDSEQLLPEILETIGRRNSENISVVGHADTAGNTQYNLLLSEKRASSITQLLMNKGIKKMYLKTTSHGEANPLIPTADGVMEPRNRRVEVVVR